MMQKTVFHFKNAKGCKLSIYMRAVPGFEGSVIKIHVNALIQWADMGKPDMSSKLIDHDFSNHVGFDRRLKSNQPVKPT